MFVSFGNTISPHCPVDSDVRQGGVIAPILFNIYMDELIVVLNSLGIGGMFFPLNSLGLCYGDHLCLIRLFFNGYVKVMLLSNKHE